MIRLLAVTAFAFGVATSAQAMSPCRFISRTALSRNSAKHAVPEKIKLTASASQEPPNVKSAVVSAGARCEAQVTFAINGSTETYR